MLHFSRKLLFVFPFILGATILIASKSAYAVGVDGTSWDGPLRGSCIDTGFSTLSFGATTVSYTETINSDPTESFNGTFTQNTFSALTFFTLEMNDGSPNGRFVGSGFALFDSIAVVWFSNPDFSECDWVGFYTRSRARYPEVKGSLRAGGGP